MAEKRELLIQLDERVLHDLAEDLGKPAADQFIEQYSNGLKQRLEVLTAAAFDRSLCLVHDTAVDLAVTSATVGASALAQAARAVAQDAVRYRTASCATAWAAWASAVAPTVALVTARSIAVS